VAIKHNEKVLSNIKVEHLHGMAMISDIDNRCMWERFRTFSIVLYDGCRKTICLKGVYKPMAKSRSIDDVLSVGIDYTLGGIGVFWSSLPQRRGTSEKQMFI
jgi:hypothetical protein